MEAVTDSTPALTDAETRRFGRYLASADTFAVLTAAAAALGPHCGDLSRLPQDRTSAKTLAEFVHAADQRVGEMHDLADHVDQAAMVVRMALMRRADYAELMAEEGREGIDTRRG